MKIVLDSTVIIEFERKNQEALELVKDLIKNNEEILISAVSVSEALVGPYFSRDFKAALTEINQIISQFIPVNLDLEIAEKIAQYWVYLISIGKPIGKPVEYQDVAIAATFAVTKSDFLLTQNKKHFEILPEIGSKARTISEFRRIYR